MRNYCWCWLVYYFNHHRFQEIAGSLDSALIAGSLVPVQKLPSGPGNSQDLILKQSVTLLESLRSCWREDVFILSCSERFLRLSLQLLSRWVCTGSWMVCVLRCISTLFCWQRIHTWLHICECTIDTQTGCHQDWLLLKLVMLVATLDLNGLLQLSQKSLFTYALSLD